VIALRYYPKSAFQATMLLLLPPAKMLLPSVENATESTWSDSVASFRTSWPFAALQMKTASPLPAAAIHLPSGDTATDNSGPEWSLSVRNSRPRAHPRRHYSKCGDFQRQ